MTAQDAIPRWQPIEAMDRRVLGVLVEKAKTTSDNYPLTLNGLWTGCNQKSNRFPQMQIGEEDLEDAIERLRTVGAMAVVQGISRVDKYRHLAYEWLGVEKVEMAVMAELLLRGAQTIGELRGRASRMEPIKGIAELQPILARLVEKKLVVYLSPPGRGAVVTHSLYLDREMDKLRREHGNAAITELPASTDQPTDVAQRFADTIPQPTHADDSANQVPQLREELLALKAELTATREELQTNLNTIRGELDDLNRALGNL